MPADFKVLAYEDTPLGPLCLRRRKTLSEPRQWVTEITLNHQFLMSSLHTLSEQQLALIPLEQLAGDQLRVLIGGLGLGYTAQAALSCENTIHVEVVEYLPEVIQWMHDGLTPISEELNANDRLHVIQGDIFHRLLSPPSSVKYDAILIDVDHSPQDQLATGNEHFYSVEGLQLASSHLTKNGALALWSYDQHTPMLDAMRETFEHAQAYPIEYYNQHVHEEFTDWLYVGYGCRFA
ncbi:spermidine synthase [Gimesia panareensis]|uniref:Spermidine synthase n=1 Tax=Gimesia panareensis TaxID=2527978 RepID=A0A518FW62_9PLAN|nr:spermidine synthase [Gimesia panareensis]QDV20530.1 spermidine synthase [Gimesia panareensis]